MKVEPIAIAGPWTAGYTLAVHTVSAEFLGYDEQGHPKFDTVRSEMGEALYQLKYRGDTAAVFQLAQAVAEFMVKKGHRVDIVVPLPPSQTRAIQPVAAIAEQVAKKLRIAYDSRGLRKVKTTPELKSLTELADREAALKGAFTASVPAVKGKVVLLLDDLYRSGASMKEAAKTLLEGGEASAVYAVALTRTRVNR